MNHRETVTHNYPNARTFNRETARMLQAGWVIGAQGPGPRGRITVTWYRDVRVPPTPIPPQLPAMSVPPQPPAPPRP